MLISSELCYSLCWIKINKFVKISKNNICLILICFDPINLIDFLLISFISEKNLDLSEFLNRIRITGNGSDLDNRTESEFGKIPESGTEERIGVGYDVIFLLIFIIRFENLALILIFKKFIASFIFLVIVRAPNLVCKPPLKPLNPHSYPVFFLYLTF